MVEFFGWSVVVLMSVLISINVAWVTILRLDYGEFKVEVLAAMIPLLFFISWIISFCINVGIIR